MAWFRRDTMIALLLGFALWASPAQAERIWNSGNSTNGAWMDCGASTCDVTTCRGGSCETYTIPRADAEALFDALWEWLGQPEPPIG